MRTHHPADFTLICHGEGVEFDGCFVGGLDGRDGDPAPGDVLVVAGPGGRPARWEVVSFEHPYRRFPGHADAAVWAASVRPAAPSLRHV